MTRGPILTQVLLFSLPLMLGNVFQMLYNTVDSIVVGNFVGKEALAAVGSTAMIVNMLVFFFNGFSVGAGVVIANHFGARDTERLHDAIETTMAASFLLCGVFTVLGLALVRPMLRLMSTPEDVLDDAVTYLSIYFMGFSGLLIYNIGSGILRAVGDTTRPLMFLILTSLLNIVLDLLFVIAFGMGIAGGGLGDHHLPVRVGPADPAAAHLHRRHLQAHLAGPLPGPGHPPPHLRGGPAGGAPVGSHGLLQRVRPVLHQFLRLLLHGRLELLQQAGSVHHAADSVHVHGGHHLDRKSVV